MFAFLDEARDADGGRVRKILGTGSNNVWDVYSLFGSLPRSFRDTQVFANMPKEHGDTFKGVQGVLSRHIIFNNKQDNADLLRAVLSARSQLDPALNNESGGWSQFGACDIPTTNNQRVYLLRHFDYLLGEVCSTVEGEWSGLVSEYDSLAEIINGQDAAWIVEVGDTWAVEIILEIGHCVRP